MAAAPARLFHPHGDPPLTRDERRMLRECERLADVLDGARTSLYLSLVNSDPELCVESCRRLQSVGFLLGEQARSVGVAGGRPGSLSSGARGTGETVSYPPAPEGLS